MTEEHTCETCKYGEWYRKGRDITTMDDECGGCCSWNDKYEPNETLMKRCSGGIGRRR